MLWQPGNHSMVIGCMLRVGYFIAVKSLRYARDPTSDSTASFRSFFYAASFVNPVVEQWLTIPYTESKAGKIHNIGEK